MRLGKRPRRTGQGQTCDRRTSGGSRSRRPRRCHGPVGSPSYVQYAEQGFKTCSQGGRSPANCAGTARLLSERRHVVVPAHVTPPKYIVIVDLSGRQCLNGRRVIERRAVTTPVGRLAVLGDVPCRGRCGYRPSIRRVDLRLDRSRRTDRSRCRRSRVHSVMSCRTGVRCINCEDRRLSGSSVDYGDAMSLQSLL